MNGAALLTCRCSSPHRNFWRWCAVSRSPALCQLLCCLAAGKMSCFFSSCLAPYRPPRDRCKPGNKEQEKDFVTPSFLLSPAAPWNAEVAPLISQATHGGKSSGENKEESS